jgi:Na+/glutamate symporter
MATPSPATAMFYFYINGLKLDDRFFVELKFAYSLTTIVAMIFFYYKLRHIPFKSIFSGSNICYFTVSLMALVLVTRYFISIREE